MTGRLPHRLALLLLASLGGSFGCDDAGGSSTSASDNTMANPAAAAPAVAESGHFTGRITMADGSPITLAGVKYTVDINGVTAVGERNNFKPKVGADGAFKLKLPQGMFYPPFATITVPFEGKTYVLPLDPVDPVTETRDSSGGIVQNFLWRFTGPKPNATNPDINNATHWYGITVSVNFHNYREDTQQTVKPLPDGSKVVWTLKPTSKLMDGSEAKPLTVERKWTATPMFMMDALSDLPAANYEISAVATLPDGSTKPVLVEEFAEHKYMPSMKLILQPDANSNTVWTLPTMISWTVD